VQYTLRNLESLDWITLCLVSCVVIFTVAKYVYPRRFQEFMQLPITNKYFLVQGRNDEIQHPFNVLLFVTQVILVSLFIYEILSVLKPELGASNKWLFIQICTGYSVFVFIKFCIEKIIGAIFSMDRLVNSYLYEKLTYRNLLGILLFLANILLFYVIEPTPTLLLIITMIVLTGNGIALFYSYKTHGNIILKHFLYFILYLCALEISPYIILYKVALT